MNIADTIDGARRAFQIAGRGCLVRFGEDEPRYATVAEIRVPSRPTLITIETVPMRHGPRRPKTSAFLEGED